MLFLKSGCLTELLSEYINHNFDEKLINVNTSIEIILLMYSDVFNIGTCVSAANKNYLIL